MQDQRIEKKAENKQYARLAYQTNKRTNSARDSRATNKEENK